MPAGSVVITPTQMYNEIQGMSKKVDHLAAVMDPALTTLRQEIVEVARDVADHEMRLRSLDKRIWLAALLAAAGGIGGSQLLPYLGQ